MTLTNKLKSLLLSTILLLPLAACGEKAPATTSNTSEAVDFMEDVHYATLPRSILVGSDKSKIEVVEMFWYGCPHCYRLEPSLNKWKKNIPSDIEFISLPSVLNPSWALHAKAFFGMEMVGASETLHEPFFQALHEQGRNLNSEAAILRFAESVGVDSKKLQSAMNSLPVDKKVREVNKLGNDYGLTGVPAMVIAGKYKLLSGGTASYEEQFQLVDFLINKERNARK